MSATAEQFEAVAKELRAHDLPSLADSLDIYAKKLLPAPDPDLVLAQTLVDAYCERPSYVTEGWLRVVAAAREALTPRAPRKFYEGNPEPKDITYVYDEDGDLFKRIAPNYWVLKKRDMDGFGPLTYEWDDVNEGNGATEVFGDLG